MTVSGQWREWAPALVSGSLSSPESLLLFVSWLGRDPGEMPGRAGPGGGIPGGAVRGTSLRSRTVGRLGSASGGITSWMPGAIPGGCPGMGPGAGGVPLGWVGAAPPFVTTAGGGSSRDGARVIGLMIVRTGFSFPSASQVHNCSCESSCQCLFEGKPGKLHADPLVRCHATPDFERHPPRQCLEKGAERDVGGVQGDQALPFELHQVGLLRGTGARQKKPQRDGAKEDRRRREAFDEWPVMRCNEEGEHIR